MISRPQKGERKQYPKISIVDAHNQAFYYLLKAQKTLHFEPAILAHFDAHHDMLGPAPTAEFLKWNKPELKIRRLADYTYAAAGLNEANFICAAAHYGIVGSVYCFDPRDKHVVVYGDPSGLKTRIEDGLIRWEENKGPPFRKLSVRAAINEITKRKESVLLDIDLDAYLSLLPPDDLSKPKTLIKKHARYVSAVINKIPAERVAAITIAKSQTPSEYVPSERVPEFLAITDEILRRAGLVKPLKANTPIKKGCLQELHGVPCVSAL